MQSQMVVERPILLDEHAAATYLGGERPLSVKTLQARRLRGLPPYYIRVGRLIRYEKKSLDQFLESGRCRPTSQPEGA